MLPGRQGKGIASALLAELERRMRAKGVLKVNALIHDDNERSLRLFAKLGFTADRRSVQHWKVLKPKGEPDRP